MQYQEFAGTGANIHEVANAVGSDTRIGSEFLKPGQVWRIVLKKIFSI